MEVIWFDDTVGTVAERPTAVLRVAGFSPARNKFLYGLHVVVPGLAVCVCDFFVFIKRTHDTGSILSVGQLFSNKTKTMKGFKLTEF